MPLRALTVLALLASVGGCRVNDAMALDVAQGMLAKQLKDPDSAQFRGAYLANMTQVGDEHSGWMCGEVNARNGFGGYSGYQRFVAQLEYNEGGRIALSSIAFESPGNRETFDLLYATSCK